MTGDEHKAQQVVTDVIVKRGFEIRHECLLPGIELTTKLLVLALEELAAAKEINGAMLGGGHEPGARVLRDARLRPLLERVIDRSEERRVGKECRSRWSPYH